MKTQEELVSLLRLQVFPKLNRVVVDGVNTVKKHKKPSQANPEGSIIEMYAPIDASNVMIIDPKTKKPTRVSYTYEVQKDGSKKKVRISKASNSKLD